jgi:transposase
VNPDGEPVALMLTGGEAGDSPQLPELTKGIATLAVLGDKGYDSDANRALIASRGADACIPPRQNRNVQYEYDRALYRQRNEVERYFGRLKWYRRVAMRYDKRAQNYLGFVWVASISDMLSRKAPKLPSTNP